MIEKLSATIFVDYKNKNINMDEKIDNVMILWETFQDMSIKRSGLKQSSIQTFETTRKSLMKFRLWLISNGKDKNFVLSYYYLTHEGIDDFYEFLISEKLKNTTIHKRFIYYKKFLYWLGDKGYIVNGVVRKIEEPRLQTIQKKVVYLTIEELQAFYRADISNEGRIAEEVRDSFVFACFTGLRFSDLIKFNWDEVEFKENRIAFVSQKTSHLTYVELNNVSKNILFKHFKSKSSHLVFDIPKYTITYNKILKRIARKLRFMRIIEQTQYSGTAKIVTRTRLWQAMSSHTARRTFVCLCLHLDIRHEMVMKWTGHTTYRGIKPYIDVMDSARQEQMNKLNAWESSRTSTNDNENKKK